MRDLVPFVQFKKREKHPCANGTKSRNASQFIKSMITLLFHKIRLKILQQVRIVKKKMTIKTLKVQEFSRIFQNLRQGFSCSNFFRFHTCYELFHIPTAMVLKTSLKKHCRQSLDVYWKRLAGQTCYLCFLLFKLVVKKPEKCQ